MARIAIIAAVALLAAAPALGQSPPKAAFLAAGPFLAISPKGGFVMLVKKGNAAAADFVGHKIVINPVGTTWVVPDVNGDGASDIRDFRRGDKIKFTKRVVPKAPEGSDPLKVGKGRVERVAAAGQTPPPPPPGS